MELVTFQLILTPMKNSYSFSGAFAFFKMFAEAPSFSMQSFDKSR